MLAKVDNKAGPGKKPYKLLEIGLFTFLFLYHYIFPQKEKLDLQ